LVEEVATPRAVAEALFASINGRIPFLHALVDAGAVAPELLDRYLARAHVAFVPHVTALPELVERLPEGICERLLALPVRRDPASGAIEIAVADPSDPHAAREIAFHLGMPVRVVRAPVAAIEEALRRLRILAREDGPMDRFREAARAAEESFELERRSRPARSRSLPPPAPALAISMPSSTDIPPRRGGLVIDTDSAPPPGTPSGAPPRVRTPPWGTPVHNVKVAPTDPPSSGYGSEIPIPLTRRNWNVVSGGTQRPPPFLDPTAAGLGEGYAIDTTGFRDVVEKGTPITAPSAAPSVGAPAPISTRTARAASIPGPPPLPAQMAAPSFSPEVGNVLAALRNVSTRDEILDLVLTGARVVALKVALFVVKKGGYVGWSGTVDLADRAALQRVAIPLDANSIFDSAVRQDLYLGPLPIDDVHAPLFRILASPTRDVVAVPIKVTGKTAVIILADDLGDTMIGTRRLEEIARAAGEAFSRMVRTQR
jgi:hypothetical protein